jgi:hypothetical protein
MTAKARLRDNKKSFAFRRLFLRREPEYDDPNRIAATKKHTGVVTKLEQ